MSEFQELIKNFSRIRDYMRQFYIYGFKVRNDFDSKSSRTYDNERRRMESMLSGFAASAYTAKGKQVYINVDSKAIPENPLYAAWKSKSFTDNDLMLHFFLLDLLWAEEEGKTAHELADEISFRYGVFFDSQIVRLKCREYEKLGILKSRKEGKLLRYRLMPPLHAETLLSPYPFSANANAQAPAVQENKPPLLVRTNPINQENDVPGNSKDVEQLWPHLMHALKFYQGAAPFGIVGSTILDRENLTNDLFQFKHHFIVHTLEDGILLEILEAMEDERSVQLENKSRRSKKTTYIGGIPLKIMVSAQSGRRYLCMYLPERRRFNCFRLDCVEKITAGAICTNYPQLQEALQKNVKHCWGVSFGGRSRKEEIHIKFWINEENEAYILDRITREGRGGELMKIRDHEYLYSGCFFDTNEMLSWVKTFTGRILDIQGSNRPAIAKITHDWDEMYRMYFGAEE